MVEFGEVRSLLHSGRAAQAQWERLCALCEEATEAQWAEGLGDYVMRALASWPDALRRAPDAWLESMLGGAAPPACFEVARALEVVAALYAAAEDQDVRRLADAPLDAIARLALFAQREDCGERTDVWPLLERGQLGGLNALEIGGELTTLASLTRLAELPLLARIEEFGFHGGALDSAQAQALSAMPARGLTLRRVTGLGGLCADAPLMARVSGLMVCAEAGAGELPGAGAGLGLRALWVEDVQRPAVVERLVGGALEVFGLARSAAPAGLLEALAGCPLRALALVGVEGEGELVAALCARDALAGVERLSLGLEGAEALVRALASGLRLERLRWLQLVEQGCEAPTLEVLARVSLPSLEALELMTAIGAAEAGSLLAGASWLGQLNVLKLICAGYGEEQGARTRLLAAAPQLERGLCVEAIWSFRGQRQPMVWDVFGRPR